MRPQSVSAGEHAQVLQDDGFKKGRHQLIGWGPHFLQAVDIGFREYAAFARNFVKLDPVISLIAELHRRNLQLGIYLVDNSSGAAGALVIHRRNLLLAPSFFVIFEDNDLGVLSTELDD